MSRAGTTRPIGGPRGRVLAGLHRAPAPGGGPARWSVVLVDGGPRPAVSAARSFSDSELPAMRAFLAERKVAQAAVVVPATRLIGKIIEAPAGTADEMAAAAGLIAEAELPSRLPPHRRAAGIVNLPAGPGRRAAMLVAWLGDAPAPTDEPGVESVAWTPEPLALAALLDGPGVIARADAHEGAVAVLAAGPSKSVLRSLREDLSGREGRDAAVAAAEEAAALAGLTPGFASGAGTRALWLDPESARRLGERLGGASTDGAWLDEFGVAAGAALALAACAGDPASRPLLEMSPDRPRLRASPVQRVIMALARPRTAYAAIAASIALMVLGPLALAAARHAILTAKAGGLSEQQQHERELNRQLELYKELGRRRWPVSKLLADLAGAMPVGVELQSITLDADKNSVALQGSADKPELVNALQSKLNASGVFTGFTGSQRTDEQDAGRIAFDSSGAVASAFAKAKGTEDFSTESLAKRLYGEEAAAAMAEEESPRDANGRGGDRAGRDGRGAPRAAASGGRPAVKPVDVPPPISDDEIAALDYTASMRMWSERKRVATNPAVDAAAKERLKAEIDKLKARMDATKAVSEAAKKAAAQAAPSSPAAPPPGDGAAKGGGG